MSKNMVVVSKTKESSKQAGVPLLSIQGYTKKGVETEHQVSEISKILSDYSKAIAHPKDVYPFYSSRYINLKIAILKRLRTVKFHRM